MTPSPSSSLLCALCLVVAWWPDSAGEQSHSHQECLPRVLEEPGITELAYEDSRGQLSLLQTNFHIDPGTADVPAVKNVEFGFPPEEDKTNTESKLADDSSSHESGPGGTRDRDAYQRRGLAQVALSDEMASSANAQDDSSNADMSWSTIVMLVLVGCSGLGLLIYTLVDWWQNPLAAQKKTVMMMRLVPSGFRNPFLGPGSNPSQDQESLDRPTQEKDVAVSPPVDFEAHVQDVAICPPVELDPDTFGMAVCSLTRDSYFMSLEGISVARVLRVSSTLLLVLVTITIQVFLLAKVKQFVCARAVHDIREAYDTYEVAIYGKDHTTMTVNGKHRGIPAFMPPLQEAMKRLNTLKPDDIDAVCRIPLSQPHFFGVILLIWTLTCVAELRKAVTLQTQIIMLKTVPAMDHAMRSGDEEDTLSDGIIYGMTVLMKVVITLTMFIPRVSITLYLLWVGCRWLLATTSFSDLILNAVALEFVLCIKDVLHVALMPARSSLDLSLTKIEPYPKRLPPAGNTILNFVLLFACANMWVFMYMRHWQQVLPEYKWDVHDVCTQYIKERYAV